MLVSLVWDFSPVKLIICWFIFLGTILCTLHQTQWQEIPTDIWWWTLPASSRVSWTVGKRQGATGRICLPPDIWEVPSQVRTDQTKKPERTVRITKPSPCLTVPQHQLDVPNICLMNKRVRKPQIWKSSPE